MLVVLNQHVALSVVFLHKGRNSIFVFPFKSFKQTERFQLVFWPFYLKLASSLQLVAAEFALEAGIHIVSDNILEIHLKYETQN